MIHRRGILASREGENGHLARVTLAEDGTCPFFQKLYFSSRFGPIEPLGGKVNQRL